MFKIPLTPQPNQKLFFTATINGENKSIEFNLRYINDTYWVVDIINHLTKEIYLTNIPLIPADDPFQNILYSYDYLWIGSMYIVPNENTSEDGPNGNELGISWFLLMDDNYLKPDPKGLNTDFIAVWN